MPQAAPNRGHASRTTSSLQTSRLLLQEATCAYMPPYVYTWAHHKLRHRDRPAVSRGNWVRAAEASTRNVSALFNFYVLDTITFLLSRLHQGI